MMKTREAIEKLEWKTIRIRFTPYNLQDDFDSTHFVLDGNFRTLSSVLVSAVLLYHTWNTFFKLQLLHSEKFNLKIKCRWSEAP